MGKERLLVIIPGGAELLNEALPITLTIDFMFTILEACRLKFKQRFVEIFCKPQIFILQNIRMK